MINSVIKSSMALQVVGNPQVFRHGPHPMCPSQANMVLLGFAIMTSSQLRLKGYEICKFPDTINTDCSGLTDV
jgi:hypothetical protein